MKIIYYTRVFFVSVEFLIILAGDIIFLYLDNILRDIRIVEKLNEAAIDWLALAPIAITVWTLTEARGVISPDRDTKALNEWPEYWKLKAHFYVGLITSILLSLSCSFIWLVNGFSNLFLLWSFGVFLIALLFNAGSFYLAKINIRNILSALD